MDRFKHQPFDQQFRGMSIMIMPHVHLKNNKNCFKKSLMPFGLLIKRHLSTRVEIVSYHLNETPKNF